MDPKQPEQWNDSKRLARAILHDRKERRKWLGRMLMVPIAMIALGLWVFNGWIDQTPLRMLVWWGTCAFSTVVVMLFALYDALAVIREEREKHK
jgi:polyferredoxin